MEKDELIDKFLNTIINLKRIHGKHHSHHHHGNSRFDIGHSKKITLLLLHKMCKNEGISLSMLREEIRLAPSTTTAIISELEKDELIERIIDKEDRRNIFIKITDKGIKQAKNEYNEFKRKISKFADYMGEEDFKEFLRLAEKIIKYDFRNECMKEEEK
ncbi:MAG: MarR family transcriptional regulator [Clostridia bacterium]|nr:MarR family transcriptional regulator [Clostridia bacterium]